MRGSRFLVICKSSSCARIHGNYEVMTKLVVGAYAGRMQAMNTERNICDEQGRLDHCDGDTCVILGESKNLKLNKIFGEAGLE